MYTHTSLRSGRQQAPTQRRQWRRWRLRRTQHTENTVNRMGRSRCAAGSSPAPTSLPGRSRVGMLVFHRGVEVLATLQSNAAGYGRVRV